MSKHIGKKYGTLTILSVHHGAMKCMVRCDCGNVYERWVAGLHRIKQPTCSDCRAANAANAGWKHPLYMTWKKMKARCSDPNLDSYNSYGGRGIKVCKRWDDSLYDFADDMGEKPDGYTLDRIDNDGDYEPDNCRWSTNEEQLSNTRRNVYVKINGDVKTATQWCKDFGIVPSSHFNRVRSGMTHFEAFKYWLNGSGILW